MIQFHDIQITDKELVEKALHHLHDEVCHISFASLFLWKNLNGYQIWTEKGVVVIRCFLEKDRRCINYFVPAVINPSDNPDILLKVLKQLKDDGEENGYEISFHIPSMRFMPMMRSVFPDYGLYYNRALSEYLYSRKELSELKGDKFRKKRTLIHQFTSRYKYTVSDIDSVDFDDCIKLFNAWREAQKEVDDSLDAEAVAIKTAFKYYHKLGLIGKCIRVDGKLIAFNIGGSSFGDVFEEYFEKAEYTYRGAFAFVNLEMAKGLPNSVLYINREEDLGQKSLREAKMLYHPIEIIPTYMFKRMTPEMLQIRELWLASFTEDGADDAEQFLLNHFDERKMAARYDGERLIAMGHLVRFGTLAYLYAVCVHPDYRGHGLSLEILGDLYEMSRREGLDKVVMIPANNHLRKYFSTHTFAGDHIFSGWKKMRFHADDGYDFGTGDPEKDIAAFCVRKADIDNICFREGRVEDSSFIAECVLASVEKFEFGEEHPSEYVGFEATCSMTDTLYSYRNAIIAETNGRPVGCLIGYPGEIYARSRAKTDAVVSSLSGEPIDTCSEMETGPGEYYLDLMGIVPEFRGHGLGHALMKAQMERGRSMGYHNFSLIVSPSFHELREYYKRLGFQKTGELRLLGEKYEKMNYVMVWG